MKTELPIAVLIVCALSVGCLQTTRGTDVADSPVGTEDVSPREERPQPGDEVAPMPSPAIERVYLGPDGKPLPFKEVGEVLEFLRTAEMHFVKTIGSGSTKPGKYLLEKDGVRAHAIFHDVHDVDRGVRLSTDDYIDYFQDSYLNQVAAYEVSRLLGITNTPPTVVREVAGREGSLALWIENAINERDRIKEGKTPPNISTIKLYFHDMRVFDNLINNFDRSQGNVIYDANWQAWLIDHTRAFGRESKLSSAGKLQRCSVSLWEKLQALDPDLVAKRLTPYIGKVGVATVMTRRDRIVSHLRKRIASEGRDAVLFHYPRRH